MSIGSRACGPAALALTGILGCSTSPGAVPPPPPPPPPPPTIVSVSVAPASLSLAIGATGGLTATVVSTTGPVTSPTVSWTSGSPAVATVSGTGATATVTAVAAGTTLITATAGSVSGSASVTVAPPPPAIPRFDWHVIGAQATHAAWGAGRWVALGSQGRSYTSTDGARWTGGSLGAAFTPFDLAWTGTRFVAIGAGGVYSSPDGVSWTKANGIGTVVGPLPTRRSIIWTGAKLIASDGGLLFTSPDGLAWTTLGTSPASTTTELVWTGTLLAANIGSGSAVVVSADTGKTWATSPGLSGDLQNSGLAWDGSRFVKWRGRTFGHSTNGLTWTEIPTTIDWRISGPNGSAMPIEDLIWSGDRYLALAYRSFNGVTLNGGAILSSPDGAQWTELDTGRHGILKNLARSPTSTLALGAATLQSNDGSTWSMRLFEFDGGQYPITWSIDRFLVAEDEAIMMSRDGVTWQRFPMPFQTNDAVATWTGSLYVVAGQQGRIATSPDGATWTLRSSGTTNNLRDMLWAGGRVVAIGQQGAVTSSADGISWAARSVATGQLDDLEWTGNRFVTVSGNVSYVSPDGLTWAASAPAPAPINRLFWTGTELIGMNRFRVVRSPDGLTWTLVGDVAATAATALELESIVRVGSVFVGCQTLSSALLYSADARTWSSATTPEPLAVPCEALGWSGSELLVGMEFGLAGGVRLP